MSKLLSDIQAKQLKARKENDAERSKLLTTILGEIQRSPKKVETDKEVITIVSQYIKKIRNDIQKNPFKGQDTVLAEMDAVEKEFLPDNKLSHEQIKSLIDTLDDKSVRSVMPFLSKYEKQHDVIIDKAFAKQYIS